MCCCKQKNIKVSYNTQVVEENKTIEHKYATSIYFTNKSGVSAYVNQIEVGVGETLNIFKNDCGEKIVTNFQISFDTPSGGPEPPISPPFPNRLYVIYEYKTYVEPNCKK